MNKPSIEKLDKEEEWEFLQKKKRKIVWMKVKGAKVKDLE